jgi:hypothetical protein
MPYYFLEVEMCLSIFLDELSKWYKRCSGLLIRFLPEDIGRCLKDTIVLR